MSERRDNTTEQDESSPTKSERTEGSYYYDDATGYEVYDPAKDVEDEVEEAMGETMDKADKREATEDE